MPNPLTDLLVYGSVEFRPGYAIICHFPIVLEQAVSLKLVLYITIYTMV